MQDHLPAEIESPANRLGGVVLKDKWVVGDKLLVGAKGGDGGSGGNFSVSYIVTDNQSGKTAFLKAFDFYQTLRTSISHAEFKALRYSGRPYSSWLISG